MKTILYICTLCLLTSLTTAAAIDSTGIKLIYAREFVKAQAYFEAALKAHPNDTELQYFLALSLQRQHKIDEAQDVIESALEKNDGVSKYHSLRGAILGEKARDANVISQGFLAPKIKNAFLRAAELDPKNLDAHEGLFQFYAQAPGFMGGSEEKALVEGKTMVNLNPYRGHMMLAGYYANKKDGPKAESEYAQAIQADPTVLWAHYQFGMFLNKQHKPDLANAQFRKMIEIAPKDVDAYFMYGRAMFNLERWDEAIEKFQYALYLEKNNAGSIWMLANCYEKKGMNAKAKDTYQWLLQVDAGGKRGETARQKVKELQ